MLLSWRGFGGNAATQWDYHPNSYSCTLLLPFSLLSSTLIPMPPIRTFRVVTLEGQCRTCPKLHTAYDIYWLLCFWFFKLQTSVLLAPLPSTCMNDLMRNHENTHFAPLSFERFTFRCHTFPRPALPAQMLWLLLRNFLPRDFHPYHNVISAGSHQIMVGGETCFPIKDEP